MHSPSERKNCAGTELPLTYARERPSLLITRRSINSSSQSISCSANTDWISLSSSISKIAVISVRSQAARTMPLSERSPRTSPSAPTIIDLPAPVSPVKTVMPALKGISSSSITAKFLICRCFSKLLCPTVIFRGGY